jgi:hypothetical protein
MNESIFPSQLRVPRGGVSVADQQEDHRFVAGDLGLRTPTLMVMLFAVRASCPRR